MKIKGERHMHMTHTKWRKVATGEKRGNCADYWIICKTLFGEKIQISSPYFDSVEFGLSHRSFISFTLTLWRVLVFRK